MATLKEFEEALREHGMNMALALLERLRERDRATRTVKPARRLTGQKMTRSSPGRSSTCTPRPA